MVLYYAIFEPEDEGFNVSFPDLKGALTCGNTMSESLYMAKDVLEGWLVESEDAGEVIPKPSAPFSIQIPEGALLIPIEVNVKLAREKFENKLVKKTLTIPSFLNRLAEEEGINFSATLTEALKLKLGLKGDTLRLEK